jgi:hypothetical protein
MRIWKMMVRQLSKDRYADIGNYFVKLEGGIKRLGGIHLCRAIPKLTPDCMVAFLLARVVHACQVAAAEA